MKISVLTPDFSHNCFGRAWLLAKLLQKYYDVEIVGPSFNGNIWEPLRNFCNFEVKKVRGCANGHFEFKRLLQMISGDVIYASKPLMTSFGVGLAEKMRTKKHLVLDIDDLEIGTGLKFYNKLIWPKKIYDILLSLPNLRSYFYTFLFNKLYRLANCITVSGKTLQKIYGGTIIGHGRDLNFIDPNNYNKDELKKRLFPNLKENSYIVGFIGSPRLHKGIEDLIDAFKLLENEDIILLIVGSNRESYSISLKDKVEKFCMTDRIIFLAEQPFEKIFQFLSIIDLVVIPQRKNIVAHGQVPAKIFDAMAMAKPIISTDVYDIPDILGECGWIISPENKKQLADAIQYAYFHPDEAETLGKKAREKCKKKYSWEVIGTKLFKVFEGIKINN